MYVYVMENTASPDTPPMAYDTPWASAQNNAIRYYAHARGAIPGTAQTCARDAIVPAHLILSRRRPAERYRAAHLKHQPNRGSRDANGD